MDHATMNEEAELWLFGSAARGDTDRLSDIDLLVVGKAEPVLLRRLPFPTHRLSVVSYDWPELRHMASYGSLFLHHVRLEGKPLDPVRPSYLGPLLQRLPPYKRADHELRSFKLVLTDVEQALDGDHAPAFELSVIATALRHSCILGCYAIGRPTFGRRTAFQVFLSHVGLESLIRPTQRLYDFRLYEDARSQMPFVPTTADVHIWLERARITLNEVERALDARD